MASSRLTTLQVHERFKQNCNVNTLYSRQKVPKEDLFDDSLTNLQWLHNLNVNIVNPIPPLSNGGLNKTVRVSACYRRIRGHRTSNANRNKPKAGDVTQVKEDSQSPSINRLQSNLSSKPKNGKNNPLPPLIPQSRTPLPSQYRSRAGSHGRDPCAWDSQKDSLPPLCGSNDNLTLNRKLCENAVLTTSPDVAVAFDTATNQYVLSPRQMDRDLLPGQVDYKNNPYVKPPYALLALIYQALRRCRSGRMTIQSICEWIKNNFIYYRFVGPDWQNSVRNNLARHKCFERIGRIAGKAAYWRIHPKFEEKFSEDALRRRRLASAGEEKGQPTSASDRLQSGCCSSPSVDQAYDYEFLRPEDFLEDDDDFLDEQTSAGNRTTSPESSKKGSAGHKRKQASPRRSSGSKKSRSHRQQSKVDPVLDQEPELGSLKGEFTFTTILEEMRLNGSHGGSSINSSLSLPPTPTLATQRKDVPVTTLIGCETSLSDGILPIDPSLFLTSSGRQLPSPRCDTDAENGGLLADEFFSADNGTRWSNELLGTRRSGNALHTPTFELETNGEQDSFQHAEAPDLTVTGSKIEPPVNWTPDASLDFILGERLNNFDLDGIDLGVDFSDVTGEISPQAKEVKGQPKPISASSGPSRHANHLTMTSQKATSSCSSSLTSWQELKTATDSVRSLLASSFEELM